MRFVLAAGLLIGLAAPAAAQPHQGQILGGVEAGLTWDAGGGRLAGGDLATTVDWHGFGLLARVDYQLQRQIVVEQETEIVTEHGSGAVGIALRLSPVRMFDHQLGRVVDAFAEGGLEGGVTGKAGGVAMRGGAYAGLGAAVRFPIPRRRWLPSLSILWLRRRTDPAFVFTDVVTVSIGYAFVSDDRLRD